MQRSGKGRTYARTQQTLRVATHADRDAVRFQAVPCPHEGRSQVRRGLGLRPFAARDSLL
jgi:hypothetical protein